nr:MAG TPA: hypothetical protein [Microviridae sp.]
MIQSFVKCFNPIVLRDPRGYPYQVPCGKCDTGINDSVFR